MKQLLSIPVLALLIMFTAGCGSLGNIANNLGNLGIGGRTYTFNSLPQNLNEL